MTDGYGYSYPVSDELCVRPPSRSRCRLLDHGQAALAVRRPVQRMGRAQAPVRFRLPAEKFTNLVTEIGAVTVPFARTFPRKIFARRRDGATARPCGRGRAGDERCYRVASGSWRLPPADAAGAAGAGTGSAV